MASRSFTSGYGTWTTAGIVDSLRSRTVETEDAGGGGGPAPTYQWESYRGGRFRPVDPPGWTPGCAPVTFDLVVDPSYLGGNGPPSVVFSKAACADGWAIAVSNPGPRGTPIVGVFNWETPSESWQTISLDNGAGLGKDPLSWDLPLRVLDALAKRAGAAVAPTAAAGDLVARLNSGSSFEWLSATTPCWTLTPVMSTVSDDWLLALGQTGSSQRVTIRVYRWSAGGWIEVASFAHVFQSGDAASSMSVSTASRATTTFSLPGYGHAPPGPMATISDAGGSWHLGWARQPDL